MRNPPLTTSDFQPSSSIHAHHDLGLVMGGGGARAAYQVGVLRALARERPALTLPVITGVSAGAINAAHLAAHHGTFAQACDELHHLWTGLRIDHVFRVDAWSLGRNALRWILQLAGGGVVESRVRGLVDTQPLREFLSDALHPVHGELTGIAANIARGRLRAVALSTSSYTTGQSITWVQGHEIEEWERPMRRSRRTVLTVEHVMASSALPLFFPAVELEGHWYGDGGIRLAAPLSPALHLGASRILAVSTRYERGRTEADAPVVRGYPPPAQVVGILMNAIFLDLMDQDAHRMERLNRLLAQLPEERREGLRHVSLFVMRPSVDLGRLATRFEPRLPRAFRFLTRGLGTRPSRSADVLSLLMFQEDFVEALIRQGEEDAQRQMTDLLAFVDGTHPGGTWSG